MPSSRRPSWPTAIRAFCSAPTIKAATCCRPCSTALASRSPSAAARSWWRPASASFSAFSRAISAAGSMPSIMRIGDVILSFPTILLALLVSGIARAVFPQAATADWAPVILICAIAIHEWVQYARTVRAATMVETAEGLREGREGHRPAVAPHHVAAHPAQRDGPGAGHRDDQSRRGRADGGDTVVPRRRNAADLSLPRHADPHRQRVRVLGHLVDRALPAH